MIVVDANVVVMALASPTEQGNAARATILADDYWLGPAHMPLEVLRTLRKAVVGNRLTADDADAAFQTLIQMQIEYVAPEVLSLQAVWAMRHTVSVCDAAYLAVAAMQGAPLVTFDARLARAAKRIKPDVQVTLL